jgi:hypothetical protein
VAPVEDPVFAPLRPEKRSKKLWVLAAAVLVALAVAALVVALVSKSASTLPTGPVSATIHVTIPPTGQPSFSGTVGGLALTGSVTGSASSGGVLFNYTGSLGGTPYVLHVSLGGDNQTQLQNGQFTFRVTGTYGSAPVSAPAAFEDPSPINARSETVMVSGTFGTQLVVGTATATQDGDGAFSVKAKLTVLPPETINQP